MSRANETHDARIAQWRREGAPQLQALDENHSHLLHRVDLNGMGPLLALTTDLAKLPRDLAQDLQRRLLAREMWEEQHKRILVPALVALANAGLNPVLMKGTALAYSHYPRPSARVRGDSDILVEENGRSLAFQVLEKAGLRPALAAGGTTATAEALFQKADLTGQIHDIDLHWRLNSSPVLAGLFTHAELLSRSEPLEALHPLARRLGDADALLFAAVHRRLHIDKPTYIHLNGVAHPVIDSLSWLTDIALLFDALDEDSRTELIERAQTKAVADILSDALKQAATRLGTHIAPEILVRLEAQKPSQVARYIAAGPFRGLCMNLWATSNLQLKWRFLREMLFPDQHYMRSRFSRGRFDWLIVLHLRRILPGTVKHLRKSKERT